MNQKSVIVIIDDNPFIIKLYTLIIKDLLKNTRIESILTQDHSTLDQIINQIPDDATHILVDHYLGNDNTGKQIVDQYVGSAFFGSTSSCEENSAYCTAYVGKDTKTFSTFFIAFMMNCQKDILAQSIW